MTTSAAFRYLGVALCSASAGWWLNAPQMPASVPAPAVQLAPRSPAAPMADSSTQPAVVRVLDDGNVTLRVEREPLEWVISEIERQGGLKWLPGGRLPQPQPTSATPHPTSDACTDMPPRDRQGEERLLRTIRQGSDTDRFTGLLQARDESLPLPGTLLKTLFETDASDSVRLLAFEAYLEAEALQPAALRSALESALYVPNAGVQQEARRRLDELAERERIDAASVQAGAP